MPTQPRKLFYHHWHAYTGGVRRRPFIAFDWAGPSVAIVTGAWGMNEELTWGGPSVGMSPGAFESLQSFDYQGPSIGLSPGTFSAELLFPYSGPSIAMDPGETSFSISESFEYAGPSIAMDPGTWSFEVSYPVTGPSIAMDPGETSFSISESFEYVGPSIAMDPGTWSFEASYPVTGPSIAMMAGSYSSEHQLPVTGSSVAMNPGTFTSAIETQSLDGAQYVDGALSFTGATTIVLDSSVYPVGGNFVLFDYGSFAGGQAELNAQVTVDDSGLPLADFVSLEDQPSQSRVVLELRSKPTNGKQFVDGNLEFAGATTVYLDADLYATPGTYELFEVAGTITGLGNLTCVSSAGWTVSSISAAGGIVSVTLT